MSEEQPNFKVSDAIEFGEPSTLVVLDGLSEKWTLEGRVAHPLERYWQRTDGLLEWNLDVLFQLNRGDDEILFSFYVTVDVRLIDVRLNVGVSKLRGGHVLDVEVAAQKRQGPTLKSVGRMNRNSLILSKYPQEWLMIRLEGELKSM